MPYPIKRKIIVPSVFGNKEIELNFYSGLTIFVGPNGSGKTQTMKKLKDSFSDIVQNNQIRYLSSNRIGMMEQYRSEIDGYMYRNPSLFSLGDLTMKSHRLQIEVAAGDFLTMDEKKDVYIKVSERFSTLFNRQMFIRWDNGQLKVYFEKCGAKEEYSIVAEASGLINIISILAALYDDEIKILLIDEPEVSLHPQLQAFLLNEIKSVAGDYNLVGKKMIIMATHSTEMMEVNDIKSLINYIFFLDNGLPPKQISPDTKMIENSKLKDLIPRIGQTYKNAFFSIRPLLVEGVSDAIVCKYFDNRFKMNLGVAGVQIIPIEGKGQFPATVKLMRLIGKCPIVLTDLDGFVDDNDVINLFSQSKESKDVASFYGFSDISEFVKLIKTDIGRICDANKDLLLEKYMDNPYWKHKNSNDDNKARRRAMIATLFNVSDEEISTWSDAEQWKNLKTRIEALFECLEKVGCFILRKGAIESYYTYSSKDTFDGKPSAAVDEINSLKEKSDDFIKESYADIIRAITYSSKVKVIDESESIREELLCELPAILEKLNEHTTQEDINTIIRKSRGTDKSIFSYEPINTENGPAIKVNLISKIMLVTGFPFNINKGDNVNQIVDQKIKK